MGIGAKSVVVAACWGLAACGGERSCEETLTCAEVFTSTAEAGRPVTDGMDSDSGASASAMGAGGAGGDQGDEDGAGGANGDVPSDDTPSDDIPSDDAPSDDVAGGGADGAGGMVDGGFDVPIQERRCSDGTECPPEQPICDTACDRCVECESTTDCDADAPVCNDDGECVGCAEESDCAGFADAPLCRGDGRCVGCLAFEDCPLALPVCDEALGLCAPCEGDEQCAHLPEAPFCEESSGACVQCSINLECMDPAAPRCEDNVCVGCQGSGDCTHTGGPVCDVGSGACVECVSDGDCGDPEAPLCSPDNTCVECLTNAECPDPAAPHCGDYATCEPCEGPADCVDFEGLPACDGTTGECVECATNSDCTSTEASACVDNVCEECIDNAGCAHLEDTTVCDVWPGSGGCVECTSKYEDACVVGGEQYVCDSLNKTCAAAAPENLAGTQTFCDPCLSDAHCQSNAYCVQTHFMDGDYVGWFCQGLAPGGWCTTERPYSLVRQNTSMSDDTVTLCTLAVSSCPAMNQLTDEPTPCVTDDECGDPRFDDALCVTGFCSPRCDTSADCPGTSTCTGGACEL